MQDYGEVVCCVGSSFNSANPAIFIQADIRRVQVLQNHFIWLLFYNHMTLFWLLEQQLLFQANYSYYLEI